MLDPFGIKDIIEMTGKGTIMFILHLFIYLFIYLFMIVTHTHRERGREAETQAGSMHREPDVGFDPGSPGSCPRPKGRRQTAAPPRDPPGSV